MQGKGLEKHSQTYMRTGVKARRKGYLKYIGNDKRVCQNFYSAHPLISLYHKTVLRRSKQQLFAKS